MHITIKHYKLLPLSTFLLMAMVVVILWQPAIAQPSSLPSCTATITDTDDDGVDAAMDIDKDGDGLIELCSLEGLNAIRHQLDGTGYRADSGAEIIMTGCPDDGGCRGYELVLGLDFADADSYDSGNINTAWTTAAGWLPIGTFNAIFEGNGYTLSNLRIERSVNDVGLFSATGTNSRMTNISLFNAVVTGQDNVGSLVGNNGGSITNSYASEGMIEGRNRVGGLVGNNQGDITNSYAASNVTGNQAVGGLVGFNDTEGSITNSYAASSVSGTFVVGGLVGRNFFNSNITNSYATGAVTGRGTSLGGLVGINELGLGHITNSYATGKVTRTGDPLFIGGLVGNPRDGGFSNSKVLSLEQLQERTTATDIYSEWSTLDWDFGTATQNPRLKYAIGDPNTPACGIAEQPSCGSLLPNQFPPPVFLDNLTVFNGLQLNPDFDPMQTFDYTVVIDDKTATSITLQATATTDSVITMRGGGIAEVAAISTIRQDIPLTGPDDITITIAVSEEGKKTSTYRLSIQIELVISLPSCLLDLDDTDNDDVDAAMDIDKDNDGLIEICDIEGLDAMRYQLDGTGYRASIIAPRITAGCPDGGCRGYELVRSLDFQDATSYDTGRINPAWTTGKGWLPIGTRGLVLERGFDVLRFHAAFEGNGHTISNLMINRPDEDSIGLFGALQPRTPFNMNDHRITNVGLLDAVITGGNNVGSLVGLSQTYYISYNYATGVVAGDENVGGLVGSNIANSNVTNNYATSAVTGSENVGGLVGLVGDNDRSMITNSYATGDVMGGENVGGLVGRANRNSNITNSYATGDVTGDQNLGSLAGSIADEITNSYTTSDVPGNNLVGDIVDENLDLIMNSRRLSIEDMQSPTTATGIYSDWSTADWDFGNNQQYPALKSSDGRVLANQFRGLLDNLTVTNGILTPAFNPQRLAYAVAIDQMVTSITLQATATTDSAITIRSDGIAERTIANTISQAIPVSVGTTITIVVSAPNGRAASIYMLTAAPPSSDASLSDLALTQSDGTLIPLTETFDSTMTSYRLDVMNPIDQVQVIATATHPAATITVDSMSVASGEASQNIRLTEDGVTMISIRVTAQDGTTEDYVLAVSLIPSSDASLSDLVLTRADGTVLPLDNTFLLTTTTYTVSVAARQVRVMPTATAGDLSEITVRANSFITETVASGSATAEFVPLREIGESTLIEISIDAEDGTQIVYRLFLLRVPIVWSEFPGGATAVCEDDDIDNDNDGLIEMCYLEDVNAIRYQLDGSGSRPSRGAILVTTGCGGGADNNTCIGYELVRDLDFNDDASYRQASTNQPRWTAGAGWPYIGSEIARADSSVFSGILEGNGHTIANLFVRSSHDAKRHGKFIERVSGTIRNLGFDNAAITITKGRVPTDSSRVSIFAGAVEPNGRIINCYISGVANNQQVPLDAPVNPGAFIADSFNSGFVWQNQGKLFNNYIDMKFSGFTRSLFALSNLNEISNNYILGDASNTQLPEENARMDDPIVSRIPAVSSNLGVIENIYYAVETTTGTATISGGTSGAIISSYYDSEKWRGTDRVAGSIDGNGSVQNSGGFSTRALQTPTAANPDDEDSPYYQWHEDNWYFGTNTEYPLLKYGRGDNEANPACGRSQQPSCGTLLRGQGTASIDASLSDVQLVGDDDTVIEDFFAVSTTTYTVVVPNAVAQVRVMPTATRGDFTMIMVSAGNISETVASGFATDQFVPLEEGKETTIEIVVTAPDTVAQSTYRVFVTRALSIADDDASLSGLVLRQTDNTVITLAEDFAPETTMYNARVANAVAQVQVMPTATNPDATITVDNFPVDSNRNIDLIEGDFTRIAIEVTAEDRSTTQIYTVTVYREPSTVATLSDLMLVQRDGTPISLTESFAPATTMYATSVANSIAEVRVMPTAANQNATITVGIDTVASGDQSSNIMLTAGEVTTITIVVTAQDNMATERYTIAVFRPLNSDASLSDLALVRADRVTIPLDNSFLLTTTTYTVGVSAEQVQVMPTATAGTLSEITVSANDFTETVASGSATDGFVRLGEIGENITINIEVVAQDGTQAAYRLVLFRVFDAWSEFPGGATAVCSDDDIDNDNDGLIEMCYLE
ncbi:MAG: cadherin-like beta sandwich domain-containing protein, partial [Chromatiales bacterium]|nr:cadherin-like beta sandwich domain-containing protein [Chromatiales bacterium]